MQAQIDNKVNKHWKICENWAESAAEKFTSETVSSRDVCPVPSIYMYFKSVFTVDVKSSRMRHFSGPVLDETLVLATVLRLHRGYVHVADYVSEHTDVLAYQQSRSKSAISVRSAKYGGEQVGGCTCRCASGGNRRGTS